MFDTTLRDGEQAPANGMTPDQKLEMALRIQALGVDCVEAGFPASSPSDFEATRKISRALTNCRFATFSRTRREDIDLAVEAGGTENHEVQMVATGSDIHLKYKRGISRAEAVAEVSTAVAHAAALGITHISVGIEDASRSNDRLLKELTETAVSSGATCIILADTTGCMVPQEYGELIGKIRSWVPDTIRVSTHCHDDFGLSLANALAGLEAGADEVQVTLGGIGERAGNTPLEELAAVLSYKSNFYGMHTDIHLAGMYEAYTALRKTIALTEPRNKPIFGAYAFGTVAGIHQQGILSNPATYEYVEPSVFGRARSLLVGRHSGRSILRHLLDDLGVRLAETDIDDLYRRHIAERRGSDCEDLGILRQRLALELGRREVHLVPMLKPELAG
ncbi:LeuA family protein [Streptomyces sp. AP-93]|uniref:LeuA family protein n=1 Tax=Streptomyces sp. AP-93 TaxID=2929048 RepID=UPI001FAF8875|nr:pyruvate carboxyltransferase [Streptomyces sp. AP-93]MCJ0875393.1 pyruvate carboxyltransferase [Streptomyces sp. AP-93]